MNIKNLGISLMALICLITLLALDFVIIPLGLKIILSWFGVALGFWQCLLIVIFFNIVTYGFRKKG